MGRPRTCFCDACTKCRARAAYHLRKHGVVVPLKPKGDERVDDPERVVTTTGGLQALTRIERDELRRRIDAKIRERNEERREGRPGEVLPRKQRL